MPVAREQLGVPEVSGDGGRVVCVALFPVRVAVSVCGGNCLSVHFQVEEFVA